FTAWRQRSVRQYLFDPEVRFYLLILALVSIVTIGVLYATRTYSLTGALQHGLFQAVSIATTTGFTTTDFSVWPSILPYLLIYASIIGACAGSTGGGMKVIRILLIFKQGLREIQRLIHPNAVIQIKLGQTLVPSRVLEAVCGFPAGYVL